MSSTLEDRQEYLKELQNQHEEARIKLDRIFEYIPTCEGIPKGLSDKFYGARLELITQLSAIKFFKLKECVRISDIIEEMKNG